MYKIIPSTDLRNRYTQISDYAKHNHEPVILTKNGEGDLIVMSIELFQEKEIELDLYKRLAENKMDIAKGHFQSGTEFSKQLQKYIKNDNISQVCELKETYLKKEESTHV